MKVTDKYVLFWNGPFSQWFSSSFELDDIRYSCAEQAMMAQKALLFSDTDSFNKIMKTTDPKEQKALGRKVKGFDVEIWSNACQDIVFQINVAKFGQNPGLKKTLMDTGDKQLVEASPYDKIWGIGLGENDARALDETKWLGQNLLGKVLNRVRDSFKGIPDANS
jgi:hypothetical protein